MKSGTGAKGLVEPLVTVIVPTYNRANLLKRCLHSLEAQSMRNFEVIVSDDGSTDRTREVVETFCDSLPISLISGDNSGGPARPRNQALQRARTEYVAFLDSDDWWEPTKLECCLSYLSNGADLVYHDVATRGENGCSRGKTIRTSKPQGKVFECLLCSGLRLPNSSVVTRRRLLSDVGAFCEDKKLVAVEDFDCWIKISLLTDKFSRVPGLLGYYWYGNDKISAPSANQAKKIRDVYMRHISLLSSAKQRAALSLLSYRIARIYHKSGMVAEAKRQYLKALNPSLDYHFIFKACWQLLLLTFDLKPIRRIQSQ